MQGLQTLDLVVPGSEPNASLRVTHSAGWCRRASGHPQASRRASTPNQPSSGLAAPHGAEQARSYAETKSHRLAKRSSLQLSRSLLSQNSAHAPAAAAAATAPVAGHTQHHHSRPATPGQRPLREGCEKPHTAAKQMSHQMHDHGAVTRMHHQHVADSQPQHILRTGQAQHAQRDSQVVATHQLPQAQQAQHAQRASHPMPPQRPQQAQQAQLAKHASQQQTRHRLHMGSAPAPMQGPTGAAFLNMQCCSHKPCAPTLSRWFAGCQIRTSIHKQNYSRLNVAKAQGKKHDEELTCIKHPSSRKEQALPAQAVGRDSCP